MARNVESHKITLLLFIFCGVICMFYLVEDFHSILQKKINIYYLMISKTYFNLSEIIK